MNTAKLIEDVFSYKKTKYASKGDEVKIISEHGEVLIVENKNGNRFPVKKIEIKI